jgi:hypothetical protein
VADILFAGGQPFYEDSQSWEKTGDLLNHQLFVGARGPWNFLLGTESDKEKFEEKVCTSRVCCICQGEQRGMCRVYVTACVGQSKHCAPYGWTLGQGLI